MLLLSFSCSCATNQSCTLPLMVVLFLELISSKFCQAFYCCWILHHVAVVVETVQQFIPKHNKGPSQCPLILAFCWVHMLLDCWVSAAILLRMFVNLSTVMCTSCKACQPDTTSRCHWDPLAPVYCFTYCFSRSSLSGDGDPVRNV